ncbi:protein dj-1beta-like isoform X1 [Rhodnius prolixus]|uniref:DJ-1_PfpI domain-containing protein n=3 Tax=Rhodnius prolixus TaxID=13249 RepID=T1HZ41_RHOPR
MYRLSLRKLIVGFSRFNYTKMSTKSALVLVAEGSEEMECIISVDVLRRGGVNVTLAGLEGNRPTKCSRDVVVVPDKSMEEAIKGGPYDAIVLPGGMGGSKSFAASSTLGKILKEQEECGKIVAAICAAPTALKAHGIGLGKCVTCYPGLEKELLDCYKFSEDKVVVDGNIITSRGPGTAFDFGLALVEKLVGKDKSSSVKKELLL